MSIWEKIVSGSNEPGQISLNEFPFLFTLLTHCGFSGLVFAFVWGAASFRVLPGPNLTLLVFVGGMFALLMYIPGLVANNISGKKFQTRAAPKDYDWLKYARIKMALFLFLFIVTCSLLIWNTGGLSSPFIPFYIMVFTLALNYCRYPKPAIPLVLAFVGFFALFVVFAEVPALQAITSTLILPFDPNLTQTVMTKKLFDGGFAIMSMVVPVASSAVARRRTSTSAGEAPG